MFKIEVNVSGETFNHYWMNKHKDDFIQALPKLFTRIYGEVITKDEIIAYKIDEESQPLLEGVLHISELNSLDLSVQGKIKIKKIQKAKYKAGDFVLEAYYDLVVLEVIENFKKAKSKPDFEGAKKPKKVKHDFGKGEGEQDCVEMAADDILVNDITSEELDLTGTALTAWPYDNDGNFLGNI